VRFTVPEPLLNEIFSNGDRNFTATLCDSNSTEAVFLVD
jgi:hypothetical protein